MATFADRDGWIWVDGEMVPWREAKVHVLTHTLHYGMGVFEGVRAYATDRGPAIFRLEDHTNRLFRSAHILGMKIPYDAETLNQAQQEAVRKNGLGSAYLRPMCFYGSEGMGLRADNLQVHVMIAAWEWGAYLGEDNLKNGIRVRVSSFNRHHVNVTMCRAKANGNYMNSMMALQEALHDGYDEALLLDTEGYVMEGSGENLFIVRDGVIYTPDLTSALTLSRYRPVILDPTAYIEVVNEPVEQERSVQPREVAVVSNLMSHLGHSRLLRRKSDRFVFSVGPASDDVANRAIVDSTHCFLQWRIVPAH